MTKLLMAALLLTQTVPAGYWPVEKSQPLIDKTQTIRLSPDLSKLTEGERIAVAKLLEVGQIFQKLYEQQRHPEALSSYLALEQLDRKTGSTPATQNLLSLYRLFQGPIATTLETARRMVDTASRAGIQLGVVSQHRFDESVQFLEAAVRSGRLGKLLQCDAYVKWHRTDEYYARPVKGTWATEGGGALISQAIHQVDLLRWIAGPIQEVFGMWQLGAAHRIESEDVLGATVRYANGATGVIQASTAFWPGYPERLEFHGTGGTAIVSGDQLTTWDIREDEGAAPPLATSRASGASDPMAISLTPFERQFRDFADAVTSGRRPLVSGQEGYWALEVVDAIYRSCQTGRPVRLEAKVDFLS